MSESVEQARRALFEAWHRKNFRTKYSNGQPTRDMHNGQYAERYTIQAEQERWECFNAALDAVAIELPVLVEPEPPEDAFDDSWRDGYSAADRYRKKCRAAIASTGLGIKIK
ncbi:MAG TPA: hypothetical protein VFE95_05865 [Pseudomonas sp.]|nr:hypothetical protein [Pseudomonas sp.]